MGTKKEYAGDGIVIGFEARRCIHAAECVRNLPAVFNSEKRPWIDAGGATADEIVAVVERCPSGALTYERSDGGPREVATTRPTIRVGKDGPLFVRGSAVVDHEGNPLADGARVALCRCGASNNKPFCDNSHKTIEFDGGA